MKTKKAVTMQILLFIMMGIVFIGLLLFGLSRFYGAQETLCKTEQVLLQQDIQNAIAYCADPLNKGNNKLFSLSYCTSNTLCIVSEQAYEGNSKLDQDLKKIYEGNDNTDSAVLLKTSYSGSGENYEITDYQIQRAIKIEENTLETQCWTDIQGRGKIEMKIQC